MTRGKNICNQLKEVRKRIAEENGIPLEIKECTYKGECRGTCPRCEAEVRYLENALANKLKFGKVATIAGFALGLATPGVAAAQDTVKMNEVKTVGQNPDTIKITPGSGTIGLIADELNRLEWVSEDTLQTLPSFDSIKISGTVLDANTNEPLPLIVINLSNDKDMVKGCLSDFNGHFSLKVSKGIYTLTASSVGYHSYVREGITCTEDYTITPPISMIPLSVPIGDVIILGDMRIPHFDYEGDFNTEIQGIKVIVR